MSLSIPALSIPDLIARASLLPDSLQNYCHFILRTAEFRTAGSVFEQIEILRSRASLSWDFLAVLYNIPKSTLYDRWKAQKRQLTAPPGSLPSNDDRAAPNSLLTPAQERELLAWIHQRQRQSRCPTIREVREEGARMLTGKTDPVPLTKYWWRGFKQRHNDKIFTQILDSREAARTRVKTEDVLHYFGKVADALGRIRSLKQMINMDESGFCSRMDKGRKRKCVVSKSCEISPTFQEEDGSSQLTIVSTISLSGDALCPMFITKEQIKVNGNFANDSIFARSLHFVTKKGYQDEASMVFWIENLLKSYVEGVQSELGDPDAPVFLIMDNCRVHNTPAVQTAFRNLRGLEIIWMPPHSSHFLQMLDACYFGVMKGEYRNGRTQKQKPKVAGKLIRAHRAMWNASFPTTIMRSWELTGFHYKGLGTSSNSACLDLRAIVALAKANCQDFAEFVGAPWQTE